MHRAWKQHTEFKRFAQSVKTWIGMPSMRCFFEFRGSRSKPVLDSYDPWEEMEAERAAMGGSVMVTAVPAPSWLSRDSPYPVPNIS